MYHVCLQGTPSQLASRLEAASAREAQLETDKENLRILAQHYATGEVQVAGTPDFRYRNVYKALRQLEKIIGQLKEDKQVRLPCFVCSETICNASCAQADCRGPNDEQCLGYGKLVINNNCSSVMSTS